MLMLILSLMQKNLYAPNFFFYARSSLRAKIFTFQGLHIDELKTMETLTGKNNIENDQKVIKTKK